MDQSRYMLVQKLFDSKGHHHKTQCLYGVQRHPCKEAIVVISATQS